MIAIGKKAPAFNLLNQDGQEVSLENFKGKHLILYFYPKDNTSGCAKEAIDFSDIKEKLDKINAEVAGVSPDSVASHKKFIEKNKLKITLLSDKEKKTMKDYGAWGPKKVCGKECEGVIRSTVLISQEGIIEKIWNNVKVRTKKKTGEVKHAENVLEKLLK
ncbi:MAG: thioredoxin-dependent thiol peroxidase [Deltaproteobacteria bacterium]|nr:thioredoxin-dependent thiol peroxidase [Deltaproteobacteria bacterium]